MLLTDTCVLFQKVMVPLILLDHVDPAIEKHHCQLGAPLSLKYLHILMCALVYLIQWLSLPN